MNKKYRVSGTSIGGSPSNPKGKNAWIGILKKTDKYSDLASEAYFKGDFQKGSFYERKADDLYAKRYNRYIKRNN